MMVKNTYGVSVCWSVKEFGGIVPKEEFAGSALQRKKLTDEDKAKRKLKPVRVAEKLPPKLKTMSKRTKQKVRKKLMCFARCHKKLNFVTLTFLNQVSDKKGVDILRKFIDNIKKRSKKFEYLWVAERQTANDIFKGNIHFHMITPKYFDIKKTWIYWIELQKKNGVIPRNEDFKPSSAFDIRQINSNNMTAVNSYVTKYVTKNDAKFDCQVWNCSRQVSELYTDFYTDMRYIDDFVKLKAIKKEYEIKNNLDIPIVKIKVIDLNRQTLPLYRRLDEKNKSIDFQ